MDYQEYYSEVTRGLKSVCDGSPKHPQIYPLQRKAKQSIPDAEKDERYWEKRKRNNFAAKKSRENKRMADVEVRNAMRLLEQENAMLKKEISVLKAEFGIPQGQSVLTEQQRTECLLDVPHSNDIKQDLEECAISPVFRSEVQDDSLTRMNVKSQIDLKHKQECEDESRGIKDYNNSVDMINQTMALYAPLNAMLWAATPAVPVKLQQRLDTPQHPRAKNKDFFARPPFQYYMPYSTKHRNYDKTDNTTIPDDLSVMKKNNTMDYEKRDEIRSEDDRKTLNGYYNYMNHKSAKAVPISYNEDFNTTRDEHLAKENHDLKQKLIHLSTQVQEMKNVVMID